MSLQDPGCAADKDPMAGDIDLLNLMRAILDNATAVIGVKAMDGTHLFVNAEYVRLFGRSAEEYLGKTDFELFPPEFAQAFRQADLEVQRRGETVILQEEVQVGGELRTYLSVKFPVRDADGVMVATGIVATDMTEQKRLEQERDAARAQLRTLEGLLPICSYCKKIRDEVGEWSPMETFISAHSEADFTHGICPDCRKAFLE